VVAWILHGRRRRLPPRGAHAAAVLPSPPPAAQAAPTARRGRREEGPPSRQGGGSAASSSSSTPAVIFKLVLHPWHRCSLSPPLLSLLIPPPLPLWLVFASSGDHLITNWLIITYCFLYLCMLLDILCCCLICIASHHVLVVAYALKSI
jgi:hypothetical protein